MDKPDSPAVHADSPLTVYADGALMPINVDDLVNNPTAIKQLINNHNIEARKCAEAEKKLAEKEGELTYLKTSPFFASAAGIVSILGSVAVAIGVNQVTAKPCIEAGYVLVTIGAIGVIVGSLINVLHPYAHRWFSRR